MALAPGTAAPDFELPDQNGDKVKLSDFQGKQAVALVFYPFTFTGICEGELCRLRDDHSQYTDAGVAVLAVSCDSKNSQKVWAEQQGYNFPVLSDFWPHGAVAQAYGVFNDALGGAIRATWGAAPVPVPPPAPAATNTMSEPLSRCLMRYSSRPAQVP